MCHNRKFTGVQYDFDNDEDGQYLTINNRVIKRAKQTKFLGVIMDEKLTWQSHIKALSNKLSSCTGCLNRISASVPAELHTDLHLTLFQFRFHFFQPFLQQLHFFIQFWKVALTSQYLQTLL